MATRRTSPDAAAAPTRRTGKPRPPPAAEPAPARRKRAAAPAVDAQEAPAEDSGTSLWRAGLKALDNVRQDAARRHASVIETLLGISPARPGAAEEAPRAAPRGFTGLDAFGLRKFEDVFDQRVAAALERLGMPTRDELLALRAQLDAVLAQLEQLGAAAPGAAPRTPPKPPAPAPRKPASSRSRRKAAD